jgi:hypothetical protein
MATGRAFSKFAWEPHEQHFQPILDWMLGSIALNE